MLRMSSIFHCRATLLLIALLSALPVLAMQRDKFGLAVGRFSMEKARNGRIMNSELDNWLGFWVRLRHGLLAQARHRMPRVYAGQRQHGKLQRLVAASEPFPCNLSETMARSEEPPSSVHRLRPGDFDIIASIGDSVLAGNGIISDTVVDIANEYRSLVFTTGGRSTWRKYLTLANILRVYNPRLYGYAEHDGITVDRSSVFNVAEPAALSRDLLFQARVLVKRLQRDRRVDMQQHWKLLTIFMGNNDVCSDFCHYDSPSAALKQHERDLRNALAYLRQQVPRLFINLMPAVNPTDFVHKMLAKPLGCFLNHRVVCNCLFRAGTGLANVVRASAFIDKWQGVDKRVAALPEFRTNDFVVKYVDFLLKPALFRLKNGATDYRVMAADCFHFSQLGQAIIANGLWNDMLGQANASALSWPFVRFACPTAERPFIPTWENSGHRGHA